MTSVGPGPVQAKRRHGATMYQRILAAVDVATLRIWRWTTRCNWRRTSGRDFESCMSLNRCGTRLPWQARIRLTPRRCGRRYVKAGTKR
jgi:hypothetical protein